LGNANPKASRAAAVKTVITVNETIDRCMAIFFAPVCVGINLRVSPSTPSPSLRRWRKVLPQEPDGLLWHARVQQSKHNGCTFNTAKSTNDDDSERKNNHAY
jgi:hypothetical protein